MIDLFRVKIYFDKELQNYDGEFIKFFEFIDFLFSKIGKRFLV